MNPKQQSQLIPFNLHAQKKSVWFGLQPLQAH